MANMADIAAMIAEVALPNVLFKANRTLIKSLKNNCSGLFETASQFRNLCTRMRIVNFYELQALGGRLVCALSSVSARILHYTDCRPQFSFDEPAR